MVTLGNFFFRYRTSLSPLLLLFLFLPGTAIYREPFAAALVGLTVACAGQAVRATTIGLQYIVRGGRGHRVYADDLVVGGLFSLTRNPMYVGKFLMVLGAGIAANRWPALLGITAAYLFFYHAVVLAEEAYLREKFGGEFDEYRSRVPRWIPRLRGLTALSASGRFDWKRVLLKEYSAPLGWTLPIVGIGLYNLSTTADAAGASWRRSVLVAFLVVVALFWVSVAWFKKTHVAADAAKQAPAVKGPSPEG